MSKYDDQSHLKVNHYLVILVDGLHAGPAGGAAVLGVLGHGDHMLHPILVNLLQGSLSERPETKLSVSNPIQLLS